MTVCDPLTRYSDRMPSDAIKMELEDEHTEASAAGFVSSRSLVFISVDLNNRYSSIKNPQRIQ